MSRSRSSSPGLPSSQAPGRAPRTLVAKFPKAASPGSPVDPEIFGYQREVAAYRYFGQRPPFRLPRCYVAQSTPEGVFNLILEELEHDPAHPRGVRLEVSDNGPGVGESIAAQLFEPFHSGKPSGVGIGLALAQRIARAHGGELVRASAKQGATFILTLPGGTA